jgi:hypothetical protein
MDVLTHLFLPLLVGYVLRPDLFRQPQYLALGLFGLLADFDKLIGIPGLLHSLVTLLPICVGLLVLERLFRGEYQYSAIASGIALSHLPLDIVEGVTVPLFYPLITTGVGLGYPLGVTVGPEAGPLRFAFDGVPVTLEVGELRTGYAVSEGVEGNEFGFVNGYGVATMLTFLLVFVSREYLAVGQPSVGQDGEDE